MTSAIPKKFGVGASALRKEDPALVRGEGCFTSDAAPANSLRMLVVRSIFANAKFSLNNVADIAAMDGVQLVLTAKDLIQYGDMPCEVLPEQKDGSKMQAQNIPLLCRDQARYVGDALCVIIADTDAQASDAAEALDVTYQTLPVVVDTDEALEPGSSFVWPELKTNQAGHLFVGDEEKTDAAFANAKHVTSLDLINNRLVCNYMETRACIAEYSAEGDRFTLTTGTQGVHGVRDILAGKVLKISKDQLRVLTHDVGGGFGTKVFCYREYPLSLIAAKLLGRSIVWISTRTEHFLTDAQGRDNVVRAQMAMDDEGKFLALKIQLTANMGAYLSQFGPLIPSLGASMAPGLYDIPALAMDMKLAYTNTTPVDAYRGAGRPEATYLIERLVDQCAFDMGIDRVEIRRRNFIQPDQFPYRTQVGRTYDVGKFNDHLDQALISAKWNSFDDRQKLAAADGKWRGIGLATYIEACAFKGSEPARIDLNMDGSVTVFIGTQANGQGHQTAYAQFAADQLNVDIEKVHVRQGDTDELATGGGTGGSRSIPLGGVSVSRASSALGAAISAAAAEMLEVDVDDLELDDGFVREKNGNAFVSFSDVAAASTETMSATANFEQEEATYPNGTHICEVEIDSETGVTKIIAYSIVDDFGVVVNPVLLQGQVHGGVVQGIGQCLLEHTIYSDEGQLLTASFMDYGMPRADNIPAIGFETKNVPSTTNAMGIKGAGEAGTIGACPAVMNAILHALNLGVGIQKIDMPATPVRIWKAIKDAEKTQPVKSK